jgi:hypothetical protein
MRAVVCTLFKKFCDLRVTSNATTCVLWFGAIHRVGQNCVYTPYMTEYLKKYRFTPCLHGSGEPKPKTAIYNLHITPTAAIKRSVARQWLGTHNLLSLTQTGTVASSHSSRRAAFASPQGRGCNFGAA